MMRPLLFTGLLLFGSTLLSAEDYEPVAGGSETTEQDICRFEPFAAGCQFFGLGLILGADSGGFIYGARLKYGYFVMRRLALVANGEFIRFTSQTQYEAGPDALFFIGPLFGWMIYPGYAWRYLWITGGNTASTYIHGPILGIETRLGRNFIFGVEVFHNLKPVAADINEETRITPVIKFNF